MSMLEVKDLVVSYGGIEALKGISFSVEEGQIVTLIGANGAGKTTLMRMCCGIMQPSSGEIRADGIPIDRLGAAYRDSLGYLPQEFGFYPSFTVRDYLDYMAALKGIGKRDARRRTNDLLEQLGLADVRKKRIAKLSGGMKQKLIEHFDTHEDLAHMLKMRARPGDVILFKGSRGMRMERALAMFLGEEVEE